MWYPTFNGSPRVEGMTTELLEHDGRGRLESNLKFRGNNTTYSGAKSPTTLDFCSGGKMPPIYIRVRVTVPLTGLTACRPRRSPQLPRVLTMDENSQRPKGRDGVLSSLNVTIEALNLAKEVSGITPAKAVFGSVSVLLTMIRVFCSYFTTSGSDLHVPRILWRTNLITSTLG